MGARSFLNWVVKIRQPVRKCGFSVCMCVPFTFNNKYFFFTSHFFWGGILYIIMHSAIHNCDSQVFTHAVTFDYTQNLTSVFGSRCFCRMLSVSTVWASKFLFPFVYIHIYACARFCVRVCKRVCGGGE